MLQIGSEILAMAEREEADEVMHPRDLDPPFWRAPEPLPLPLPPIPLAAE